MKISLKSIVLLAVFAILFSGAVSAGAAEKIKNPTLKDLEGHWQGNSRFDNSMGLTTTCYLTFKGDKATYSSERGGYVAKVTIEGEVISMVTPSGKRSDTCKLSKDANTFILNCDIDMAANPTAKVSKAMTGSMRLEKDK
jgi:hypothetical protein